MITLRERELPSEPEKRGEKKNLDLINLDEKINFNTINKKLLLILLLNCNLDL